MNQVKKIVKTFLLLIGLAILLGVLHAQFFVAELKRDGESVAYRGGGSFLDYTELSKTDCIATSIKDSGAAAVENTLEAVASSVSAGAQVIHLNVHRTVDNQIVVFHDWTLDCATNATGIVSQKTYDELSSIDAGFGYTWDGGHTYPYRDRGFRISRLEDFFNQFPDQKYWLNLKENDQVSFEVLQTFVVQRYPHFSDRLLIISSEKGVDWFGRNAPDVRTISVNSVEDCGVDYMLIGWAGIVPDSCKNTILLLPPSKANWFWGYPAKLAALLQNNGSDVYLWFKHQPVTVFEPQLDGYAVHSISGVMPIAA